MAIYTAVYLAEIYNGSSWDDVTSSILDVSGDAEATGNSDNALAFGDRSESRLTVRAKLALQSYDWKLTPFRITYSINATTEQAFQGVITQRERSLGDLTFTCEGYAALMRDMKAYSPAFHRRPVATKTTASSVEDPDDGNYAAGPINWLLWQAGGRPLEQDSNPTYVSEAKFWYSCDHALLSPDWAWIAAENAWDEALKLVQASGGQLYQSPDGVMRYRQPYTLANGSATGKSYTASNYRDVRERQSSRQTMDKAIVSYIPRYLRPLQDVAEDDTPRLIPAGETITFDIEPAWPLYQLETESGGLPSDGLIVTWVSGVGIATSGVDYTHAVDYTAQRVTIAISNAGSAPLAVNKVKLRGYPIIAGEAGSVTVGSGDTVKTICDGNPYIQNQEHAERLAHIYQDFYGDAHPLRTISGVVYDPDLEIGDVVALTVSDWSLSAVSHVVAAIRHSQTGAEMELDLVEIAGLPKTSDFFIVGNDHTGLTKLLGY